jgi:hypothetical protein
MNIARVSVGEYTRSRNGGWSASTRSSSCGAVNRSKNPPTSVSAIWARTRCRCAAGWLGCMGAAVRGGELALASSAYHLGSPSPHFFQRLGLASSLILVPFHHEPAHDPRRHATGGEGGADRRRTPAHAANSGESGRPADRDVRPDPSRRPGRPFPVLQGSHPTLLRLQPTSSPSGPPLSGPPSW